MTAHGSREQFLQDWAWPDGEGMKFDEQNTYEIQRSSPYKVLPTLPLPAKRRIL